MKTGDRGYALLMLLLALAVMSLVAASLLQAGQFAQRRDAELQLLEVGGRMEQALISYAKLSRSGLNSRPTKLEDLLRDPRFPKQVVRHLRRVEVDPITGQAEWGLVWSEDGKGIIGFHSLSQDKPVMSAFRTEYAQFKDQPRYADWVFGLVP